MSKLLLSAVAFSCLLFSCEKEINHSEDSKTINSGEPETSNITKSTSRRMRYTVNTSGEPPFTFCYGTGGTCSWIELVSGPQHIITIADIIDVIDTDNETDIKAVFAEDQIVLKTYIDNYLVDGVITGELKIRSMGVFEAESTVYLIYTDHNNNEIATTPLTIEI